MQMVVPLIRTKLRLPFIRRGLVPRARLRQQIGQGLRRPLTLITAPAGFGKTTLVASSVAAFDAPVAWISLDKEDNRNGRFLRYLLVALQEADQAIGHEAAQLMRAARQAPPELILTSLINDLDAAGREMVLVLDDYHFISSQGVHTAVSFLLDHCPRTFHLVILSRSDPPLPLSRWRARGQMVELRAADLGFTKPEAAQFLNDTMGLHLDDASIATLTERTEGWIAGLQMAALSMRDREDGRGFVQGFSGTNRHILDYLMEEVLAREPEAVQTFLLQTAILNRLTGPLCDAVTGASGGQEMLERLEKRNLFVAPLDDERRWYRYHHLFADLLEARLRRSGHDEVARLLSRAAKWCEHNGHVAEAVTYALAAQDFAHAAALVAQCWHQATGRGEIETLWSWLQALPGDTIRSSARLSIITCWALWFRGKIDAMASHLDAAEQALRAQPAPATSPGEGAADNGLRAELAALRAFVARYHNDFATAVSQATAALRLMPETMSPQAGAQLRAVTFLALASAHDGAGNLEEAVEAYRQNIHWNRAGGSASGVAGVTYRLAAVLRLLGRLRAAETACREALDYIETEGMARLPAAGILHAALAEILVEQNELGAAEKHLARAMELGQGSGRLDAKRNVAFALARLRLARRDDAGALTAVQEAEASLEPSPSPLARAELLALKARILLGQGSLNRAVRCVDEAVSLAGWDKGLTGEMVSLAAVRVQVAQVHPDEAGAALGRAIVAAKASGRLGAAIELHLRRGLLHQKQGDGRGAAADVAAALALAAPEGYVRLFLDEGRPLQVLLAQWRAGAEAGPLRDYASHLLSLFDAEREGETAVAGNLSPTDKPPARTPQPLVDPLSPRELEVLQIMALGRTNREIAEQLVIAPGTVKAHTASIYRKLDVANRTEAVARARQLGILP